MNRGERERERGDEGRRERGVYARSGVGWVGLRDVGRQWSEVQVGVWPRDCEVYQFPVGVAYLSGGMRPAVHARGQWAESVDEVYR